jgi:[CysO sulfur-carrier protein]-S-L-cysteine hydrolase
VVVLRDVLKISRQLIEEMVAHAREDLPNECCGLVSGKGDSALAVHRVANEEASPLRYRMQGQGQYDAEQAIDKAGEEVLAAYHSHTRSRAYPSQTDVNLARLFPHLMCMIVSLENSDEPVVKGFWLKDLTIAEAELVVG